MRVAILPLAFLELTLRALRILLGGDDCLNLVGSSWTRFMDGKNSTLANIGHASASLEQLS
jgi:hypothetical protein